MSLIGGYFRKSGPMDDGEVAARVEAFNPLPSEANENYRVTVLKGRFGHINY